MFRRNQTANSISSPEVLAFITSNEPDRHVKLSDGTTISVGKIAMLANIGPCIFNTSLWRSILEIYEPSNQTGLFDSQSVFSTPGFSTNKIMTTGNIFSSSNRSVYDDSDDGT